MNALIGLAVSAASLWLNVDPSDKARDIEHRVKVEPSQRIEIKGFAGSKINFSSWDNNEVYVKVRVRIESSDREYEDAWIESVKLSESKTSTSLVLEFEEPNRK